MCVSRILLYLELGGEEKGEVGKKESDGEHDEEEKRKRKRKEDKEVKVEEEEEGRRS